MTRSLMQDNDIDFVIHGTETPEEERQAMYSIPIGLGRYTEVPRTEGISTTELIDRIASRLAVEYVTAHPLRFFVISRTVSSRFGSKLPYLC